MEPKNPKKPKKKAVRKSSKKQVFSVTKAVKANARDRIGPPPAARILPAERPAPGRTQKHKPKWEEWLGEE